MTAIAKKKNHTDIIADAAIAFTNNRCTRKAPPPSVLDATLPETAKALAEVAPFEQKTVPPRGLLKGFVTSLIERVLTGKATVEQVAPVLTATERDYVLHVLDEVYAWAATQGFEVADWYQPVAR